MQMPDLIAGLGKFDLATPWPLPAKADCEFYHFIDCPDGETIAGAWDIRGGFDQYIGNYPIAGKSVLDVGTASGFLAFEAEKQGARVTAIDASHPLEFERIPFRESQYQTNPRAWMERAAHWHRGIKNGFWYAWHRLGSKVDVAYIPLLQLPFWGRRFDVVVAGAIIEHLANPVPVIAALAAVADEAVIIAFTHVKNTDEQVMSTATDWTTPQHDYTWWELSRGLYRRIFSNLGFEVSYTVSTARWDGVEHSRPTIIARRLTAANTLRESE